MCRVAYIPNNNIDKTLLTALFKDLEKSMGGDGNGIGGFVKGVPTIEKTVKLEADKVLDSMTDKEWDHGYLFHTRRASVGTINEENCHPFMWGDTITIHNGHIDGFGVLKLMMLENIEKYAGDGWTPEKIAATTDSNILAYFIWKRGFQTVPMMSCGTVMTMYPTETKIYVGSYGLEVIDVDDEWLFASEFSDTMGMESDGWYVFAKGSLLTITSDGSCKIEAGCCFDGKKMCEERRKKKKNKKSAEEWINEVIEVR